MKNENENLTQAMLQAAGFKPDSTCPLRVNRWELNKPGDCWVSVTFTDATGSATAYGVANKHCSSDGHIISHRWFEKTVTVKEFNDFLEDTGINLPDLKSQTT